MAQTLASAFRAHQAGHRSEAERLYRDVLAVEPRNAPALHLLGALLHQSGRTDEAISLIHQAIAIEPRNPDYHYNLGSILQSAGRMPEAIAQLEKAIALKSDYAEAHFELGNAYARAEDWDKAAANFRRVLNFKPGGRGCAKQSRHGAARAGQDGRSDRALAARRCKGAVLALAHMNLGLGHKQQGRTTRRSRRSARRSKRRRTSIDVICNLSSAQLDRGLGDQALQTILRAIDKIRVARIARTVRHACLLTTPPFRRRTHAQPDRTRPE